MAAKHSRTKPDDHNSGIILKLFDESVALFHQLRGLAERVHKFGRLTAGKRGILRGIDLIGPQTVPQMARARNVTRQHIQVMVNELMKEGLVKPAHNPAHKRSKLVQLTPAGSSYLLEITRREKVLLSSLDLGLQEGKLKQAVDVLRRVREALGGMEPALHADRRSD
jgi:DNA-binding MarR family transcriptional regulator